MTSSSGCLAVMVSNQRPGRVTGVAFHAIDAWRKNQPADAQRQYEEQYRPRGAREAQVGRAAEATPAFLDFLVLLQRGLEFPATLPSEDVPRAMREFRGNLEPDAAQRLREMPGRPNVVLGTERRRNALAFQQPPRDVRLEGIHVRLDGDEVGQSAVISP